MLDRREKLLLLIASSGGVGLVAPCIPGTFGTLPAIALAALLALLPGWALLLTAYVLFFAGIYTAGVAADILGLHDPGPVTIDEIVGYLTTLIAAPITPATLIAAFFLFRLTDIVKPWPARRLEHLPGGLGIMADDVAAGIWAAAGLQLLIHFVPWFHALTVT